MSKERSSQTSSMSSQFSVETSQKTDVSEHKRGSSATVHLENIDNQGGTVIGIAVHTTYPPSRLSDIKKNETRPYYPGLHQALIENHRQKKSIPFPLSQETEFPLQAVSFTLSDKSEKSPREQTPQNIHDEKQVLSDTKASVTKEAKSMSESRLGSESETSTSESKPSKLGVSVTMEDDAELELQVLQPTRLKPEFWLRRIRSEEKQYHVNQTIKVEDLFIDGAREFRQILVEGHAGVGKSILGRYILWKWGAEDERLFRNRFDYVFLVSLSEWLVGSEDGVEKFHASLAKFIYEGLDHAYQAWTSIGEIQAVLSEENNDNTLLIVDGCDDVCEILNDDKDAYYPLLSAALKFKNVIVVARDQIPRIGDRYLKRKNIGFTDKQISEYIYNYASCKEKAKEKKGKDRNEDEEILRSANDIEESIRIRNRRAWCLAHNPLNLAIICELFSIGRINNSSKTIPYKNFSELYSAWITEYLKRYYEKSHRPIVGYNFASIRRNYFFEMDFLATLAWASLVESLGKSGVKKYRSLKILTPEMQSDVLKRMQERYNKSDLNEFIRSALGFGFFREYGNCVDPVKNSRAFLNLSIQEFFSAAYIVNALQGYYKENKCIEIMSWIKTHKYESRYGVMLGFVSGLIVELNYEYALKAFWNALLSPPYDIVGFGHFQLIVRCLEEASCKEDIPSIVDLLKQIKKMAIVSLQSDGDLNAWILSLLSRCPMVLKQSKIVSEIEKAMSSESDGELIKKKVLLLFHELKAEVVIYTPFRENWSFLVMDKNLEICRMAIELLKGARKFILREKICKEALIKLLKSPEEQVRGMVLDVLSGEVDIVLQDDDYRKALLPLFKDSNQVVQKKAFFLLSKGGSKVFQIKECRDILFGLLKGGNYILATKMISIIVRGSGSEIFQDEIYKPVILDFLKISSICFEIFNGAKDEIFQDKEYKQVILEFFGENLFNIEVLKGVSEVVLLDGDYKKIVTDILRESKSKSVVVAVLFGGKEIVLQDAQYKAVLLSFMEGENQVGKVAALELLREIGERIFQDDSYKKALLGILQSKDKEIQENIVSLFVGKGNFIFRDEVYKEAVLDLIEKGALWAIQIVTHEVFVGNGDVFQNKKYRKILIKILSDGESDFPSVKKALFLIKNKCEYFLCDEGYVSILFELLKSKNEEIRQAAVDVLLEMGRPIFKDKDYEKILFTMLDEKNAFLRLSAVQILRVSNDQIFMDERYKKTLLMLIQQPETRERALYALSKADERLFEDKLYMDALLRLWKEGDKLAGKILKKPNLFRVYLKAEKEAEKWWGYEENPWLSIFVEYIIENKVTLSFDGKKLRFFSSSKMYFENAPKERIKRLMRALKETSDRYGLPRPSTKGCLGKKKLYLGAEFPKFKETPLPSFQRSDEKRNSLTRGRLPRSETFSKIVVNASGDTQAVANAVVALTERLTSSSSLLSSSSASSFQLSPQRKASGQESYALSGGGRSDQKSTVKKNAELITVAQRGLAISKYMSLGENSTALTTAADGEITRQQYVRLGKDAKSVAQAGEGFFGILQPRYQKAKEKIEVDQDELEQVESREAPAPLSHSSLAAPKIGSLYHHQPAPTLSTSESSAVQEANPEESMRNS